MERPVILMWGDTATGKSSLVAAALFDPGSQLPSLQVGPTSRAASAVGFSRIWLRLRDGKPALPTAADEVNVALVFNHGDAVHLKDVRGGLVDFEATDTAKQIVGSAKVILYVMEFQSRDPGSQLKAIDATWNLCVDIPKGLIFTKCELHLGQDHEAWEARRGWWTSFQELRAYDRYIERFGDAVFPTSVYGYHPESGFPAFTIGEFGELRPLGIRPCGVVKPFEWALSQIHEL